MYKSYVHRNYERCAIENRRAELGSDFSTASTADLTEERSSTGPALDYVEAAFAGDAGSEMTDGSTPVGHSSRLKRAAACGAKNYVDV